MKRNCKKSNRLVLLLGVACVTLIIVGCDLLDSTVTKEQRIKNFQDEINLSNRSQVYTHTHPDAQNYLAARISSYWDTLFDPADRPFAVTIVEVGTILEETDNPGVTGSISSNDGVYDNTAIVFEMKEDGPKNWKILKITIGGALVFD